MTDPSRLRSSARLRPLDTAAPSPRQSRIELVARLSRHASRWRPPGGPGCRFHNRLDRATPSVAVAYDPRGVVRVSSDAFRSVCRTPARPTVGESRRAAGPCSPQLRNGCGAPNELRCQFGRYLAALLSPQWLRPDPTHVSFVFSHCCAQPNSSAAKLFAQVVMSGGRVRLCAIRGHTEDYRRPTMASLAET